ncbi:acyltransferase family protein [Oceanospirillum multiglobuliferum]|uniref:Acyltransferase 3 domain-containing protein n=1 Tax=Oceanospirillum multiglobuliferum TaxID=64969 RepID=A0A1V4T1W6_9GAMM|nr:acyltransferase [Oceanospirillum multiglobuliferum]OPX54602.1 hypothetical protein BTE48_13560 [Oceanospirillum multiglobuliferum]
MKLSELLRKENNNIDLFRVIAAVMVIYGHSYAISPEGGKFDLIGGLIGYDYSGSIAVKIFFFLSGLVVTNSLLNNGDLIRFFMSRVFRIWPALILSSVLTAFVIGLILTSYSIAEYFSNKEVYSYIFKISVMNIQFTLPGVFYNNPYPNAVNGSLWTIPYEVLAYVLLFVFHAIGVLSSRKLSVAIFAVILIAPLLNSKAIFPWIVSNHEVDFLSPCFAFGAILALNKDLVVMRFSLCAGFFVLYFLFSDTIYAPYLLYASIFFFILYVSSRSLFLKLKPKADISYGVYLWGFPVQQIMVYYFSGQGVLFNQVTSILASLALGYLSWHLCEKHFIKYGSNLSTFVKGRLQTLGAIPH